MSKRIVCFLVSLITVFNIAASMSVFAAGQAVISIEGTATAAPGEEVVISVLTDIAAKTEIQGIQLIFDYSDNFPKDDAKYSITEMPVSWSNTLLNSYSLTGVGETLESGGKIRGQIKFKVPENAQNGEVYEVGFEKCKVSLSSSLLSTDKYTVVNDSVRITVERTEEEFGDLVTGMSVITSAGAVVESPEELKAGAYKLSLNINNLKPEAKTTNAYVAVKIDEKLCLAKSAVAEFDGVDVQSYATEFPITLPEAANNGKVSVEVYCWDNNMIPFSKKLVFGEVEVYEVYGRITDTDRTNNTLYPGYVEFRVEDSAESGLTAGAVVLASYSSDNVYNELLRYANAIIVKNVKSETYKIVSLKVEDLESTYETSADLYVPDSFVRNKISFYEQTDGDIGMNTYMLSSAVELYVNGVSIGAVSQDFVNAYIADNDLSEVTLRDINGDEYIDYIFVDYYVDAVIGSVTEGDGTYDIDFAEMNSNVRPLQIDKDDDPVKYILDGEEISYTDLLPGDVVSIAYDVTCNFRDSSFYTMLVSRNTVTGMVTEMWPDDFGREYYVIDGEKYMMSKVSACAWDVLVTGNAYVVLLDVFGRIASYYEDPSNKNYGIFDRAFIDASNTLRIRIITQDGEKSIYSVKDNNPYLYESIASQFYEDGTIGNRLKPIDMLVCEYTVNSNGYITRATPVMDIAKIPAAEYNKELKTFDSCPVDDKASIIDVSSTRNSLDWDYYEINVVEKKNFEDLINYMQYDVILAGKPNPYGKYAFVIMLTGGKAYVGDTPVVVYDVGGAVYDDEQGSTVDTYSVYINGELVKLKLAPGYYKKLNKGDVFVYEMDANGYIDYITVLFSFGNLNTYDSFMMGMNAETMGYRTVWSYDGVYSKQVPTLADMPEEWITTDETTKTGNVDLIYGVITDKEDSCVSLSQIESYEFEWGDEDAVNPDFADDYKIADDVIVYVCDFDSVVVSKRLRNGKFEDIKKTFVQSAEFEQAMGGEEVYTITTEEGYREMNFLFGKVVDGKITECVVVLGNNY